MVPKRRYEPRSGRYAEPVSGPGINAGERFSLSPPPPTRAFTITAVAALVGAGLVVAAGTLDWPLAVTVVGGALLVFAVTLAALALLTLFRFHTVLVLDSSAVTVVRGRKRTRLPWANVSRVTLRGPRLTFITKHAGEVSVMNARTPTDPAFTGLVAAIRTKMDADRGYH